MDEDTTIIARPFDNKCPICGAESQTRFIVDDHKVQACSGCGHEFVSGEFGRAHAESVYDDSYFFGGGAGYPDYVKLASSVEEIAKYYVKVISDHCDAGRMLDVGAACGFVLKAFIDAGWTGEGIEPNAQMARYGNEQLNLSISCGTLEEFETTQNFDLVVISQVIGHFYDVQTALANVADLTAPGGLCLIDFWDRESKIARLLGKKWHEYSPPSVLHWYAQRDLDLLLEQHGFGRIAQGVPKKYIMGAHIRSLLEYKFGSSALARPFKLALRAIPERLKLSYPPLDLRWSLYRKS